MEIKDISSNIKKFRELKSLTREYLASELDMSVSGYSKIERGENRYVDFLDTKISSVINLYTNEENKK